MTDWLGMAVPPRLPRSELKGLVLARARAARWRPWRLAAAALLLVALGGGSLWVSHTIGALRAQRDDLARRAAALADTVAAFLHGPATRLIQIPVSTGGRVGSVTIFADTAGHRWLVRCDGLAPNAPDQAYQLWFITRDGMRSAALMPMESEAPMVMALDMPRTGGPVLGAAMSIEPRPGSAAPRGPMVFHLVL
jgi:Anti-sigma-K factor rskA